MTCRARAAAFVWLVAVLLGCKGTPQNDKGPGGPKGAAPRFPVEVAPVGTQRVEYTVHGVGTVDAFERLQITARVGGAVERVAFREGDVVPRGQVLVEIEPERYEVAVRSAKAALEHAEAAKAEAEAGLARREGAVAERPGLLPAEEVETFRTRVRSNSAEVAQARAALDLAELNLREAYVRAPISGILDTRSVQTGQYVQPGTVLATLVRREPLLLHFQVPEADAVHLRPTMSVRFRLGSDEHELTAIIAHVGQAADPTSRMVAVAADITAAEKGALRPGAFADVTVPVGAAEGAPVVPQTAIRPSERGFTAFVVEGDTTHERVLTLGMRTADGKVEVRSGLAAGDLLVVRGAEALRDGATVRIIGEKK